LSRPLVSPYTPRDLSSQPELAAEFERVIMPHLKAAFNQARWLLRSEQDAADVVHDSFLRAHRYFDSADQKAWLLSIVRNYLFRFSEEKQNPTYATWRDRATRTRRCEP
jgi:DNA-directed RNA polymerase specialized sigma24 family protein